MVWMCRIDFDMFGSHRVELIQPIIDSA